MNILITGATRGIGKAMALALLEQGANVGINYKKNDEEYEKTYSFSKNAYNFKADVTSKQVVTEMFEKVKEKWSGIDVLINNAGITLSKLLPYTTSQDFDKVFKTNLLGPINCTFEAEKLMKKQKKGHIINVASINGLNGGYGLSVYSMTKAALIGFSKDKARELGKYNINVNVLIPGMLYTDMTEYMSDKAVGRVLNDNVLGRLSKPEKVADFVCQLVKMDDVSGQVFNLDSRIIN